MNALALGMRGLGASWATCQTGGVDWLSAPCNAILAAGNPNAPSNPLAVVNGPGTVNPTGAVGVTTGPQFDVPGTNLALPQNTPQAPAAWPPNSVAVLRSLGYQCIPNTWAQPLDGTYPVCGAAQPNIQPVNSPSPQQIQAQVAAAVVAAQQAAIADAGASAQTGNPNPSTPSTLSVSIQNSTRPGYTAQLQVGDTWVITVSGPPNSPVAVTAVQNGNALGTTQMGMTNSQGVLTITGSIAASSVGTWVEQWTVGGQAAGVVQFTVSAPATAAGASASGSGTTTPGTDTDTATSTITSTVADTTAAIGSFFSALTPTELLIGAGAVALLLFSGGKKGKH